MTSTSKIGPVRWRVAVFEGEFDNHADELPLLSAIEGKTQISLHRKVPQSALQRYLVCVLASLKALSEKRRPMDPNAQATSSMTVVFERVGKGGTSRRKQTVARFDVLLRDESAYASVTAQNSPRFDVGPVKINDGDEAWEIVLALLRAMLSEHWDSLTAPRGA